MGLRQSIARRLRAIAQTLDPLPAPDTYTPLQLEVLETETTAAANKARLFSGIGSALASNADIENYMYTRPIGDKTIVGIKFYMRDIRH